MSVLAQDGDRTKERAGSLSAARTDCLRSEKHRCCQHEPSEVKLQEQQHPLIVYLKPPKLQFGDLVISHEKSVFIHSEARAGRW